MNPIEKVKAAIEREGLIPSGATIMVGVSGGADSIALLHILHRLGYPVTAAHLNHSIRGAEADADEAFVKALCEKLRIPCITQKTDVPALATKQGHSLEMAAREARHPFFRTLAPSRIALAHHADDQIETFFLRAARGAGLGGLGGMRYSQEMEGFTLIRPMLGIRHAEIVRWCEEEKIQWREDASNADETIPRNRVRRQILPILAELNSRAAENILRTMDILREEESHSSKAAQRRQIRDWLIEQGTQPDFDAVEQVISFSEKKEGTQFLDLEGLRIVNEYGVLKVGQASSLPGQSRRPPHIRMEEGIGILRGPWCASVSLAKVAGRDLTVRVARPGDRMEPYGMEGSKKLQDVFTDLKIPKAQRENWPVAECGGEIIWLPGYRIARDWQLVEKDEPALHLFVDERALE